MNLFNMFEGESAREKWDKASAEREKKHNDREAEQAKLPQDKRSGAAIDALEKHLNVKEWSNSASGEPEQTNLTTVEMGEESMAQAAHNPTGAKFSGYYKGTQVGAPRPGQSFGAESTEKPMPRNFVAKNAKSSGAGQHKDAKRAMKQGEVKHKAQAIPTDEGYHANTISAMAKAAPTFKVGDAMWTRDENGRPVSGEVVELRPGSVVFKTEDGRRFRAPEGRVMKRVHESMNFMQWVVSEGAEFKNFTKDPAVYAAAKEAYKQVQESASALGSVTSMLGGKIKGKITGDTNNANHFIAAQIARKGKPPKRKVAEDELEEHGGGGGGPAQWHAYVKAHRADEGNPNSDPWYVYAKQNPQNFKKFKTYDAAKAYATKHGLSCASAGHFHDHVSAKGPQGVDEAGSPAQQAAIAVNMKKHHQKPKGMSEDEQIDGMARGEVKEIIRNAATIQQALDQGVSLDGWMYSYVTTSNDHLNSVAEQIGNPDIEEDYVSEIKKGQKDSNGNTGCWDGYHADGTKKGKNGGQVRNCVPNESIEEDWQKANKKDKTDGMSQKAVNAYKREHPGSKLKTAVTTKPSKLKKGSKSSKRRSSYCARSKGQKDMHNIDCTKTPDKAICKSRRRWNCESQEQFDAMLAEAVDKGTLQPGQYYIWTVYFDDGSQSRVKVTKDNFDPKAFYAKKNKVVVDVDYDWTAHNG